MNFMNLAKNVVKNLGTKENIVSTTHCVTRLRFTVLDKTRVKADEIKKIEGVAGFVDAGGQIQVIIGSKVEEAYKAVIEEIGVENSSNQYKEDNTKKSDKNKPLSKALDFFISCFTPIIPAIAGCGMIKVLLTILSNYHLLSNESSTFKLLSIMGDSVYYFLPFFVAYTAAKKLNTSIFSAMVLAGIILHPNFGTLGAEGVQSVSLLGLSVKIVNYSAQALPIILAVWAMSYIERFADKVSPSMVKIFLKPMITILITGTLLLTVFGPLGAILGDIFAKFNQIMNQWGWIAVGINAAIFPLLVLTGMHNALIPLIITMFMTQGFDTILIPSGLASNIAQAGAAFAVALKSKNLNTKSTGMSATVSALCGITEPALYGINLRFKKPLYAAVAGAGIAGCFAGIFKLTAYNFVGPSLLSLPIFIGKGGNLIIPFATALVAFGATFAITWALGFKETESE